MGKFAVLSRKTGTMHWATSATIVPAPAIHQELAGIVVRFGADVERNRSQPTSHLNN